MSYTDKQQEKIATLEEVLSAPAQVAVLPNGETASNVYEAYDAGYAEGMKAAHREVVRTAIINAKKASEPWK